MATISGVWTFIENPAVPSSGFNALVSFTSNGSSATRLVTGTSGLIQYLIGFYLTVYDGSTWSNEAYRTVDFGETEQTVPDSVYTWLTSNAVQQSSDPSKPETDTLYTVNGFSLTTVANAIRGKAGTSGELIFPDGYVSAIEDISSVSDLSNAKDIAFGGNESGGKYVIEDETITPLFDQIQRVTKTEDAMTFEGATESLLNVLPGGSFPSAEEWSFGRDSDVEYGITINDASKITSYKFTGSYNIVVQYTAKEAFSLLGVRLYLVSNKYSTTVKISINGEEKASAYVGSGQQASNDWTYRQFEQPINIAVGDVIELRRNNADYPNYIDLSYTTVNGKVEVTYSSGGNGGANPRMVHGIFDVIIGSVETDIPDDYQITRTTMDSIAEEVQRISGTTTKMTTTQMLTALQSITLQDKTVTPSAETQTVTPDDDYYALSSVTVEAITEDNEAVTEIVNDELGVIENGTY